MDLPKQEPILKLFTPQSPPDNHSHHNMAETDPKSVQDLTNVVQTLLQQMQDKFQTMSDQIIGRIDEMSTRIDDLEKNIADLMTQAGVEEIEATPEKAKEGQGS
uniref:Heat shock factor-binding protein 1 n=8 Tax=Percomorphaceae TaxID=1489872 RepID=A0A8P4KRZ7_DICLA